VRLFIAIEIPQTIRTTFASLLKEFSVIAPQVKWVRARNLHLTLKFLGEIASEKLGPLESVLSTVRSSVGVNLEFRGLGFFPHQKRPRVFWAGMDASANLETLAAEIDQVTHRLGFPLEERPFLPHLTLARFQPPGISPKLLQAIQEKRPSDSAPCARENFTSSKASSNPPERSTLPSKRFVSQQRTSARCRF
jgi:2'-5' RNA ligase